MASTSKESETDSSWYSVDANLDEQTQAQQQKIENEIAATQALIGPTTDFSSLVEDYLNNKEFLDRIDVLKCEYSCMRRTRGDGNCFYRAFGFAVFEKLIKDEAAIAKLMEAVSESKNTLGRLGYPLFTVEDFYDNFVSELEKLKAGCDLSDVVATYNDQGISDYLVVFLRLVTSAHLQKEEEFFSNFVDGNRDMKVFCQQDVEPMCKESDHLQIMALSQATGICVKVFCMERGACSTVIFPTEGVPYIHLLYRPGHYDILYTDLPPS